MRKSWMFMMFILALLSVLVFFTAASAQVATMKIDGANPPTRSYDGSRNFLGEDARLYAGQELYLKGLPEGARDKGYGKFRNDPGKPYISRGFFGTDTSNVYRCCSKSGTQSDYGRMAGRYFRVVDVIGHPQEARTFYLKLQAGDNGDIAYYEYGADYEADFPFIVVGFFEKRKKDFVGRQYVVRGRSWSDDGGPLTDINTGKLVNLDAGGVWKGVDFVVEEKTYKPGLVLQGKAGEKVFIASGTLDNSSPYYMFSKEDSDKYRALFGEANWDVILKGEVRPGMTKEMCRLAMGAPVNIFTREVDNALIEQWEYSRDKCLNFKGERLIGLQGRQ